MAPTGSYLPQFLLGDYNIVPYYGMLGLFKYVNIYEHLYYGICSNCTFIKNDRLGIIEGTRDGILLGFKDSFENSFEVGTFEGFVDGFNEGANYGTLVGIPLGDILKILVGSNEG